MIQSNKNRGSRMNNGLNELNTEKKQKKGKSLLIGIITFLIGLLIGGVGTGTVVYNTYAPNVPKNSSNDTITKENLDKEDKKQNDKNENKEQPVDENETKEPNTSLNLTGVYKYEYKDTETDPEFPIEWSYTLYLYENGNFWYDICQRACYGYAGNYQIKNDKIVLNKIISFGSDVGADVASSEKTMELTFKDSKLETKEDETTITYTKQDTMIKNQDFYDNLNQRQIFTDAFEALECE